MGALSIWHWLVIAIYIAIIVVPVSKILRRSGHSGWWAIIAAVPLANVIGLWVFAYVRWPALPQS